MSKEKLYWDKAIERMERLLKQSQEVARLFPNAYTGFYDAGIQDLRQRYEAGERTEVLYRKMMEYSE